VKINKEVADIVETAVTTKLKQFRKVLSEHDVPDTVRLAIFSSLDKEPDYASETFHMFKTVRLTEKYLRDNFDYIPPTTVKLGSGSFQYVSIIETLNKIQADKTFQQMKKQRSSHYGEGEGFLLEDIEDGMIFKENKFFLQNPEALR
jgi:hypothetical protein